MYQIERIIQMEKLFDDLTDQLNQPETLNTHELQSQIDQLETYYTSPLWKEDFDADRNHLLPEDLKRGILSEDGIYLLLEKFNELKRELN